jgi:hypothetical protein
VVSLGLGAGEEVLDFGLMGEAGGLGLAILASSTLGFLMGTSLSSSSVSEPVATDTGAAEAL